MENGTLAKFITAFVVIMLGVVLVGVTATNTTTATSTTTKTENIDLSTARIAAGGINATYPYTLATGVTNWRNDFSSQCIPSSIVFKNASTTFTTAVDYTYTSTTGGLVLINTAVMNGTGISTNTTTVTYDYCPDGYVTQDFGRTAINIIPGFFGIAIMLIGVGLFYSVAKQEGLI